MNVFWTDWNSGMDDAYAGFWPWAGVLECSGNPPTGHGTRPSGGCRTSSRLLKTVRSSSQAYFASPGQPEQFTHN